MVRKTVLKYEIGTHFKKVCETLPLTILSSELYMNRVSLAIGCLHLFVGILIEINLSQVYGILNSCPTCSHKLLYLSNPHCPCCAQVAPF